MAKITVPMLPQAREEYDQSQLNQLISTLEQMIFILNNTYTPVTLGDEENKEHGFYHKWQLHTRIIRQI